MHGGRGSGAPRQNRNAVTHSAYDAEMRALHDEVRLMLAKMYMAVEEAA